MKLRTEIQFSKAPFRVDHSTRILSLGSCFADRMGLRLLENKFKIQVNPFGILYNPFSIRRLLEAALQEEEALANDLFQHNGRWHSFHFHSDFSHADREGVAQRIGDSLQQVQKHLAEMDLLILTFGTARVWKRRETKEIVANCHKVPQKEFIRERLSVDNLVLAWATTLHKLIQLNPNLKILTTVSPVRHVREGLAENTLSKSVLRLFCDELERNFEAVSYFPAYEIMVDDLRDYRFYEADLIHPNGTAENYIWKHFTAQYCDSSTLELMESWGKIRRALAHRPFDPLGEAHRKFLENLQQQLIRIGKKLECQAELQEVNRRLAEF